MGLLRAKILGVGVGYWHELPGAELGYKAGIITQASQPCPFSSLGPWVPKSLLTPPTSKERLLQTLMRY